MISRSSDRSPCTVVIPTFNERENLPVLVTQLMDMPDVRVLVVDDASPDGTGEVANRLQSAFGDRVGVIHRAGRGGLGSAYVAGFRRALADGSRMIVQMDADLSHGVRYLPDLIRSAADADLVIGSRYVRGGGVENWPASRHWLSRFANLYVRRLTGLAVADCTAGYRCWRGEALAQIPLQCIASNGYAFQVEMVWEAVHRGLRVVEVPIVFVERRLGRSKLTGGVVFESILLPWRLRWRERARTARTSMV